MTRIRSIAIASALGLLLGGPTGTVAAHSVAEPTAEVERPPEASLEGLADRLLSALRALLENIPQYEMPEITDDGDIVIRRKRPEEGPAEVVREGEITEL